MFATQDWALLLVSNSSPPIFDLAMFWRGMTYIQKETVLLIGFMALWSVGLILDRLRAFSAARRQSRMFAPAVAGALREAKLEEAIKISDRYKKSHLAKVVVAGLQGIQYNRGTSATVQAADIAASRQALYRAEATVVSELRQGLSDLATISCVTPGIGLFGAALGIVNAFHGVAAGVPAGLNELSGGLSIGLAIIALSLIPATLALMMNRYFTARLQGLKVEIANTISELIDYFIKLSHRTSFK